MEAKELSHLKLFAGVPKHDVERAARWFDGVEVPEGYHLLDQGRFPHEFFVVVEGTVRVEREGETLAELGPGDFFGEIALTGPERRTATVVSSSPVRLAVMAVREFDTMRAELPAVAAVIDAAAAERLGR